MMPSQHRRHGTAKPWPGGHPLAKSAQLQLRPQQQRPEVGLEAIRGRGSGSSSSSSSEVAKYFFNHVKGAEQLGVDSRPSDNAPQAVLLVRKQRLGSQTLMETLVQGTRTNLKELRVRLVHPLSPAQGTAGQAGSIAFTSGTDLRSRHRLSVESTIGGEADKQSLSTSVSSDLASRIAWGLALSYKLDPKVTLFSRFSDEDPAGKRLVLQAVGRVGSWDTISAMWAAAKGRPAQAAFSWTRRLPYKGGSSEEAFQFKLLCGSSGAYVLSLKLKGRI